MRFAARCFIAIVLVIAAHLVYDLVFRTTDQTRLDNLTLRAAKVLSNENIEYWATSGTLFGAHLDQRTRYADFDCDLSVLVADANKIRGIRWQDYGLVMYEGFGGFRVKSSHWATLRVDIILVYIDTACACVRFGWPALEEYPFKYKLVPAKFIFPLQKTDFGSGELFVPNQPYALLKWQYGNFSDPPLVGFKQLVTSTFEKHMWTRLLMPNVHFLSPTMPY